MSKPVILTGIRANNDLHIGNYFGAMLPIIDMAKNRASEYQINMFVPDLHSFTTPINHRELHEQIVHNVRVFTAAGLPLDHGDIHIYRQSYVPAHSELTWILDCFTGFGEMRRMTQFKDKARASEAEVDAAMQGYQAEILKIPLKDGRVDAGKIVQVTLNQNFDRLISSSVGLFNYPVLMAADILLYDARYVPVGDDQTQHLEFTRDIAERMNHRFVQEFPEGLFTVPVAVPKQHEFFGKDQGLRIKDLVDPTKKMSKSDETGKGVIFLSDTPETATKKIMSATTDSVGEIHFDREKQPGIANLLQMLSLFDATPLEQVLKAWEGKTRYGDLKKAVAEAAQKFLADFQTRLQQVDDQKVLAKLARSEELMNKQANQTLLKAQRAVGLRTL